MPKSSIRSDILARRSRLSAGDCLAMSLRIQETFLALPQFDAASSIALYSPFRQEVHTEEIFRRAREKGKRVAYPRVLEGDLEFVEIESLASLRPGAFGILEPAGDLLVPLMDIDLLAVPGVVFDLNGHRLGYGKGFYDRILHRAAGRATLVGLCYELQLVSVLPAETHDVPMDLVVTEGGSQRCFRSPTVPLTFSFTRGGNEP